MNLLHRWLCSSSPWKKKVGERILPWALEGLELGPNVLEVGPGYGAVTERLCSRVGHLTCVEIDSTLAEKLRLRTEFQNLIVVCESATDMSFRDSAFDGVVCFTMLHHVPSVAMQDQLLAEVARVLRPGGIFAGTDSRYSRFFGLLHLFDTMVVVEPSSFSDRLRAAGFEDIRVDVAPGMFRFRGRKRQNILVGA
ncbi:MAG TPA: class I SAM-dependent methyltransferase [Acidobacteriaceae bacterium]